MLVNIIMLCLIKESFKKYYLLIYVFIRVPVFSDILNLFTLPILMLISIIIILMCLMNYIGITNLFTDILMCNWRKISVFNVKF